MIISWLVTRRQGIQDNLAEVLVAGPGDVYSAALSPGGAWLLYLESESTGAPGGASAHSVSLMRRAVGGGSPEKLLELSKEDTFRYPSNAKDNSPCVLFQSEGKDLVFYSLDPVSGKGSSLGKIEITPPAFLIDSDLAPDGSCLAFAVEDKGEERIKVLTLSDGTWRQFSLEPGNGHLQSLTWAAAGKGFFASSRRTDSFDLLHINLAGKVQPLFHSRKRQWLHNPLPSPNGKYLAFGSQTYDSNVWMVENF